MLILGDQTHHNGRFPWVTGALVVTNVLAFILQLVLGQPFTNGFSLVPKEITELRDLTHKERVTLKVAEVTRDRHGRRHVEKRDVVIYVNHYTGPFPIVLTLFTSMFLHADVVHLIGNLWFLLVFARNVECALNHGLFLVFYLLCGVAGGLAHVATDPHSVLPCLGASGAISGVLGAYVAIHPLNKILCWFGLFFGVIEVPALVVIGVWFLFQYLSAFIVLDHPELGDRTAHWAHLGGFLAGVTFIWGTIFFLKWQQARRLLADDDELADEAPLPPVEPVPDPFSSFLPPTAIQAGKPRPTASAPSTSFVADNHRR